MQATYIQNVTDGLWYPWQCIGTGQDVTLACVGAGVPTPPPYIPTASEPLVSLAAYLVGTRQTALQGITQEEWAWFAVGISDLVEMYCNYSWRINAVAVPARLQQIVARMIKADIDQAQKSERFKSENMTNYSYTMQDVINPNDIVSQYKNALAPFRVLFVGM